MIRHIALFKWNDGAQPDLELVHAQLAAVMDTTPGAGDLHVGTGLALSGNASYHFGVVADFSVADSYFAYRNHDQHQALLRDVLVPASSDIAAIQLQLDS